MDSPEPPVLYAPKDIYNPFLAPGRLSREQCLDVLAAATRAVPGGRVWFVLVTGNWRPALSEWPWSEAKGWLRENRLLTAFVHFEPELSGKRLRRGRYCNIVTTPRGLDVSKPYSYVQVSAPDAAFGSELEAPITSLLPFREPVADAEHPIIRDDEELVALVDAARAGLLQDRHAPGRWKADPIHHIEYSEHDLPLQVYFGWSPHGGAVAFIERAGVGFRYRDAGRWVN